MVSVHPWLVDGPFVTVPAASYWPPFVGCQPQLVSVEPTPAGSGTSTNGGAAGSDVALGVGGTTAAASVGGAVVVGVAALAPAGAVVGVAAVVVLVLVRVVELLAVTAVPTSARFEVPVESAETTTAAKTAVTASPIAMPISTGTYQLFRFELPST
jgi:hypothetical protein